MFKTAETPLNLLFLLNALAFVGIAMVSDSSLLMLMLLFTILFVFHNLRRPILLDYLTEHIDPKQRATMLSIESQLKSLTVIVIAPVLGLAADIFSITHMFAILSALLSILYLIFLKFEIAGENAA